VCKEAEKIKRKIKKRREGDETVVKVVTRCVHKTIYSEEVLK
jgi:hypothetical protein